MSSDVKRKREEADERQQRRDATATEPAGGDALPSSSPSIPAETTPALITAPSASSSSATPAAVSDAPKAPAGAGAGAGARSSGTPARTVMVCGKGVALQGGGKRRKLSVEAMVLTAYKKELALTCKVNDMVSALEMYREMKAKGIKQDLGVRGTSF